MGTTLLISPPPPPGGTRVRFREKKVQLQALEVRGPNPDLEGAFREAVEGPHERGHCGYKSVVPCLYMKKVADLAIKNRLPSMHEVKSVRRRRWPRILFSGRS